MDNDLYKRYSVFRSNFARHGKNSITYLEDVREYQKAIHEAEKKNKSKK